MKNFRPYSRTCLLTVALTGTFLFSLAEIRADSGFSVPNGYITWKAAAGTGTVKKSTALSVPFYTPGEAEGCMAGEISAVTTTTLTDLWAGWKVGQLSTPASPHLIKMTSGAATGRTLLISTTAANTEVEVTIDARDLAQGNLTTLGIAAGDTYEIFSCPTLSSLFGTPSTTGILGGMAPANADSLMISNNGQLETYYFNTPLNRWIKVALGNPDASNMPIRPDTGIIYSRLAATEWTAQVPGRVSATERAAMVKNSGTTILAQNWPLAASLLETKIQEIPGWTANSSVTAADKVKIVTDGNTLTYWFDGAHWRKQVSGSPVADTESIPAGSAVILEQLGSQSGYSPLAQPLPYSLE